jgi:serine/threonine protein kinase
MKEIPKKIGKYDVISVLGRGAMGVVYRGHDPYVDRPVAIKLASQVETDSEGMARRLFINEARSAGRLDHPNVLKVYEAGEEEGRPYMVTDENIYNVSKRMAEAMVEWVFNSKAGKARVNRERGVAVNEYITEQQAKQAQSEAVTVTSDTARAAEPAARRNAQRDHHARNRNYPAFRVHA